MDDSLFVRILQGLGNLSGDGQGLGNWNPARERGSLDQLHHQRVLLHAVDRRDVGMIERGQYLRFALKARETVGILCEGARENFYRDIAAESRIAPAVDLPHAAGSKLAQDLVGSDPPG